MPDEVVIPEPVAPVETPVVDTPVVEPVVVAPPPIDWADTTVQERAAAALANATKWGDAEQVEKALEISRALDTDEGISKLFLQAGQSLGLTYEQMNALFGTEEVAPVEEEEVDPDAVLTRAEAQALFERQWAAREKASSEELAARQVEDAAKATTRDTLAELKITDPNEIKTILTLGDKHLAPGDLSPESVQAAIRKGHAEYEGIVEARAQAYIKAKRQQTDTLPGSTGGTTAGGDALPEPQTVAEAGKRARAAGLFGPRH